VTLRKSIPSELSPTRYFLGTTLPTETLVADRLLIAAGVRSSWARRRKIAFAELLNELWVLPPARTSMSSRVQQAFQSEGLDMPRSGIVSLSINDHEVGSRPPPLLTWVILRLAASTRSQSNLWKSFGLRMSLRPKVAPVR
jgi:hypothetical protein